MQAGSAGRVNLRLGLIRYTQAMRALALLPLALLALAPADAQLSPQASSQTFAAECQRMASRDIPALERRYGIMIDRGTAHISRATWARMDRVERMQLHWPLAFSASCAIGRRGTHKVRVIDEQGRELAFQMISTALDCHGDHAMIRPEDTEYLC